MIIPLLIIMSLSAVPTHKALEWHYSSSEYIRLSWSPSVNSNENSSVNQTCILVIPPEAEYEIDVRPVHAIGNTETETANLENVFTAEILKEAVFRHHRIISVSLNIDPTLDIPQADQLHAEVFVHFTYPNSVSFSDEQTSDCPDPLFSDIMSSVVLNNSDLDRWRINQVLEENGSLDNLTNIGLPASGSTINESSQHKILIEEDGVYSLPLHDLFEDADPENIQMFNLGIELPINVILDDDHSDDRIEFYGAGYRNEDGAENRYTDTNAYWVHHGDQPGLRSDTIHAEPGHGMPAIAYRSIKRIEENNEYFGDDFLWKRLNDGMSADFPINTDAVYADNAAPVLRFRFVGASSIGPGPHHHVRVFINHNLAHEGYFYGYDEYLQEVQIPESWLIDGVNVIRVEIPGDASGNRLDVIYIDWFEIEYSRRYRADSNSYTVQSPSPFVPGLYNYIVSGFPSSVTQLYRISDNAELVGFVSEPDMFSGLHTLRFTVEEDVPSAYIAVTEAGIKNPEFEDKTNTTNWKTPDHGADYIIISYKDFIPAIERLANYRKSQGFRVAVVDVEDIYDQFNYGIFSPEAITAFCRYAFYNWQRPAPAAVLLVGDASWDYKSYMPRSVKRNYVPAYGKKWFERRQQFQDFSVFRMDNNHHDDTELNWDFLYGTPMVDDQFVCVSGNDNIPDMMIGRFCVETPAETGILVEKTIRYERLQRDKAWQKAVTYITGGFNDAEQNIFSQQTETLIDVFVEPSGNYWRPVRIYKTTNNPWFGMYEDDIISAIDNGSSIVSFFGHAGSWSWEAMFDFEDISRLNNAGKLPFVASMTCNTARFANPELDSFGEAFVNTGNPDKGAVAFWGGCTFGGLWADYFLSYFWHQNVFEKRVLKSGASILAAKTETLMRYPAYDIIIEPYTFLGDPLLRLALPSFPTVHLAGLADTFISQQSGGHMQILAFITHTDGPDFIGRVELLVEGYPTGIFLQDDGLNGDFGAGNGVYGARIDLPEGVPANQYRIGVAVVDIEGNVSTFWPMLHAD